MGTILTRSWWAVALSGVAAVLFGVLAFSLPRLVLASLVILFGAFALVDGIFQIIAAVEGVEHHASWVWPLARGIIGVLAGLLTFALPRLTAVALLILIAVWAIAAGATEIFTALELRKQFANEWLLLVLGALSMLFGLLIILRPAAGALALIGLIGTFAIIVGVLRISLAFRLRSLQHKLTPVVPTRRVP